MLTVTVNEPFLVFWEGHQHGAPTTLTVPEDLAQAWLREGWATAKPPRKRRTDSA